MTNNLVLRFRAPDRPGIIAAIAPLVTAHGCDIRAAEVYGDADTTGFFSRIELVSPIARTQLEAAIAPVAAELALEWDLKDTAQKMRVLIAVSKFGHCLVDLIHKYEIGLLPVEIVGVVSNHEAMRKSVE